jgi:uncharacterized membrane protein
MSTVEKFVDVNVPVRVAYDQWTQFEDFPKFMEGIRKVEQLDDKRMRWVVEIAGKTEQYDAEITEQVPDQRIAWRSTSGPRNNGVVSFHHLDANRTRVLLEMEYEPRGAVENAGDMLGVVSMRVKGDLDCFKKFIEARGVETGAWRGSV